MGKTYTAKTPPDDFKVTTPKNLLLSKQAITSKGISVPYTNLQLILTPIPNWTCSVVTISHFQIHDSQYMINQLRGSQYATWSPTWEECWLQSSSVNHTVKIKKLIGHKTLRCTNTVASSRERWTTTNFVFSHNLHEQDFASHSCNLWWPSK